jgi:two-component system phosphate regulon sensor histidine kinase PhoR
MRNLRRRWMIWRRRLPRGLTLRLAAPFVVMVAVGMLALGIFLTNEISSMYEGRLKDDLQHQALIIGDAVSRSQNEGGNAAAIQALVIDLRTSSSSRITIIDRDGDVIADSDSNPALMESHAARPEVIRARANGLGSAERISATLDVDFLYVAVMTDADRGTVVRLAEPLTQVHAATSRVERAIWIAAATAIAATVVLSLVISARIVSPLTALRRQAVAVARGDLDAQVEPSTTAEIGDLGRAFNTMTRRLGESRAALTQTQGRLEAVLAGLSDGVVLTDRDGVVLRVNDAAAEMFQVTETQAIGQPFVQVCRDHELDRLLRSALQGEDHSLAAIEHGLNRKTLLTTAHVIREGSERLGLVVLRDISELRRLESVRREFVANVSHELRTPLASIRALVETLEVGAIDDPAVAGDFLARIVGEVDRLTALVEDLLDLARLEAGRTQLKREWVDPSAMVHRGADRLRPQIERAQLQLEFEAQPSLPQVSADVGRIEQVLVNLVHNAIKFTPPGGTITVRVRADDAFVTVLVEDTGIGVAPEELARLFERFYKSDKARRSEGTGLGLAIAKHIVQAHGGDISATSVPGEGSTFRFTLPVQPVEPSRSWRIPSPTA